MATAPPRAPTCAPPCAPIRVDAEVRENRREGGVNRRLVLRVAGWPGFGPGQFTMLSPGPLAAASRWDPLLPRPMAVFRAHARPGGADVEILYKIAGRGTALLAEALQGQAVRLVGPLGRAFPDPRPGERPLVVAGGTGIASVYELAARLARSHPLPTTLLFGARTGSDLMGRADFAGLAGVELRVATEDGSEGERGLATALLERALAEGDAACVYACGPVGMLQRAAELAGAHGRRCVVSVENHMACGFGVCLGCAVPRASGGYALVCREGPVFDADAIGWAGLA